MTRNPDEQRSRNWLEPHPDETPRERERREAMCELIDWLARKMIDEAIAEAAERLSVPPSSVDLVLVEDDVPVPEKDNKRRKSGTPARLKGE